MCIWGLYVFSTSRTLRPEDFKENVKLPPPKTSKFARLAQQASAARADLEADLLDDAPDSSELGGMGPWCHGAMESSVQFKDVRISWKFFEENQP